MREQNEKDAEIRMRSNAAFQRQHLQRIHPSGLTGKELDYTPTHRSSVRSSLSAPSDIYSPVIERKRNSFSIFSMLSNITKLSSPTPVSRQDDASTPMRLDDFNSAFDRNSTDGATGV